MEKASTPRNRLTRSSAKQVNTPKNVDKEESVERSPGEEVKQNVRKTRRRYDSKTKTNGDTTNIENRMNIEDKSEEGASDKYENEDCNDNSKSQDSQKNTLQKNPSPVISRRSLRARRSLTPGPEMELSASKKMKRSSSFGKLDSVSTPTNRRGRRANSESKDFVFTPSKDNQRDSHDLNCKYIPNTTSRIIGKIDEVNEGEKSSEDEREALHREPKDLNKKGFKEEDKIIEPLNIGESFEKESIVKQSNVTENKTYVGETEDPNNINKELYDHVAPNDPCLPNDCDRVEVLDMSENISVLSDKNMVKEYTREEIETTKDENSESKLELRKSTSFSEENEIEEINTSTKIKYNESNQGPCILPNEDGTDETNTNNEPEPEEIKTDKPIGNDELSLKPLVLDEDNDIEETDTSKNVENNESSDKPCLLAVENKMEPPMVSIFAECIKIPESCSLAKERVQPSELQNCELSLSKSLCNSEDKLSNASDEISQNKDCEISKSEGVYENVGIHEKPVMSSNEINIENCETESDSDNNKTEIVLDNGMEVFDCESAADSKSSSLRNPKIKVGNESPEISKIEVIDSSDSEAEEEQCKVSIVMESKNNEFISENEKLPESATEKNILLNQSLQKQIEEQTDEFTTLATGESSKVDPEIRSDHGNLESVKVEENNVNYDSLENTIYNKNETASSNDEARIDRIEDGSNGKTKDVSGLFFVDTEPIEPFNVDIRNQHNNFNDNPVLETHASDVQDEFVRDSLLHDSCPVSDEEQKQNEFEEKETNNGSSLRPNDHEANQFNVSPNKDFHSEFAENFDEARDDDEEDIMENYENEELNKSEEDSCDIYKGLSDSGSYVDEKAEGSQFGESLTSELHSGSVDSEEEYVTSVEDEEEKTGLLHELSGSADQKLRILSKDADEAKNKNPDSPMTYDKALAIINKNRVNKIDDEEFFDMFTQELNRVSEQSGSDSDIAIVDEYIMEPEEPAKKNLPKSGNSQNPKQPPRPTGPALANQPIPHENYPGDFNQSIHGQLGTTINQHGHPIPTQPCHQVMQRVNFSQGPVYQPVDQNMHLRGQLMYHQYAHSSSSLQDPHMYNSSHGIAHPDVNFSGGVLSHPHSICPVSESPFPPNNSPIKIRSLSEMNSAQTHARKNYSNPDQFPLDERHFEHQEGKDNFFGMNSTSVAEAHNLDTSSTRPNISDNNIHHEYSEKKVDKSKTPILDLLGLDSKSLKLLKKVLGLNSIKRELMKRDLEWQKRCLEKSILKSELRQQGRKKETRFRNIKRLRESDSSSIKSSSEESSEEWSATNSDDNREVNIEGGSVFVTLKSKKNPRHLIGKEFVNFKKTCYPGQDSIETGKPIPRNVFSKYVTKNMLIKNKKQFSKERRSSGAKELDSKKMTKKQSTVVKSQCGAFTVDPLTASSQSSDSEFQSLDSECHAKELKRKVKRDLASGKNKLSNMFAQNSVRKSNKSKVSKSSQENKGPLKKGKSMEKLTSEILETLAKEDKKKKRQRTEESGSDDTVERPKKIRKRSQKLKVKSKATDQNYIPFVTGGATEFGLSRLDKDGTLTLAEKAAKFRTDQLYGAPVKRITILDFKHQWC